MAEKIGFIKLERKIIDWEWYTDPHVKSLFIHMLLLANHSGKKWRGVDIERGSFVTSRGSLASETGLTIQNVRTALKKLESTGEITIKSTNKNTLIIVTNYNVYQSYSSDDEQEINHQANHPLTNNQPSTNQQTNHQLTTTKNVKNIKNDKNVKNNTSSSVIEMPLLDGTYYSLEVSDLEKYKQTHPNIDVDVEAKKMQLWLEANPKKRKTKRGMPRFINGWLNQASSVVAKSNNPYGFKPAKHELPTYSKDDTIEEDVDELRASLKKQLRGVS